MSTTIWTSVVRLVSAFERDVHRTSIRRASQACPPTAPSVCLQKRQVLCSRTPPSATRPPSGSRRTMCLSRPARPVQISSVLVRRHIDQPGPGASLSALYVPGLAASEMEREICLPVMCPLLCEAAWRSLFLRLIGLLQFVVGVRDPIRRPTDADREVQKAAT
ncbi:hypothetical protein L226DRAFT_394349 [Lentinus tigrinus ALCF2SS1-7]|uniref:uncharacterized protein n=1 Tax=Lentinus tigrinus ALCF2SS1-7 TaxID=1328758 RepID=UPI0011663BF8|nr:hypothetical protein L226DRAFT_394349 [Lentinus tigrinus ALCF2SS1-7]